MTNDSKHRSHEMSEVTQKLNAVTEEKNVLLVQMMDWDGAGKDTHNKAQKVLHDLNVRIFAEKSQKHAFLHRSEMEHLLGLGLAAIAEEYTNAVDAYIRIVTTYSNTAARVQHHHEDAEKLFDIYFQQLLNVYNDTKERVHEATRTAVSLDAQRHRNLNQYLADCAEAYDSARDTITDTAVSAMTGMAFTHSSELSFNTMRSYCTLASDLLEHGIQSMSDLYTECSERVMRESSKASADNVFKLCHGTMTHYATLADELGHHAREGWDICHSGLERVHEATCTAVSLDAQRHRNLNQYLADCAEAYDSARDTITDTAVSAMTGMAYTYSSELSFTTMRSYCTSASELIECGIQSMSDLYAECSERVMRESSKASADNVFKLCHGTMTHYATLADELGHHAREGWDIYHSGLSHLVLHGYDVSRVVASSADVCLSVMDCVVQCVGNKCTVYSEAVNCTLSNSPFILFNDYRSQMETLYLTTVAKQLDECCQHVVDEAAVMTSKALELESTAVHGLLHTAEQYWDNIVIYLSQVSDRVAQLSALHVEETKMWRSLSHMRHLFFVEREIIMHSFVLIILWKAARPSAELMSRTRTGYELFLEQEVAHARLSRASPSPPRAGNSLLMTPPSTHTPTETSETTMLAPSPTSPRDGGAGNTSTIPSPGRYVGVQSDPRKIGDRTPMFML